MNQTANESARLSSLRENPKAQVLIIGGGINGLATFRDLALQGVDVVLVEKNDYCSGASSASSHMIHGGVRYLENGEIRLVKESLAGEKSSAGSCASLCKTTEDNNSNFLSVLWIAKRSNTFVHTLIRKTKRARRDPNQGRTFDVRHFWSQRRNDATTPFLEQEKIFCRTSFV